MFRVWEVHTHQYDVLTVYQDRGSDGTLVDVLSVNNSFPPPFFVQHDSNPVFVRFARKGLLNISWLVTEKKTRHVNSTWTFSSSE